MHLPLDMHVGSVAQSALRGVRGALVQDEALRHATFEAEIVRLG